MDTGLPPVRVCGYLVASAQVSSNFRPDIERNLTFRGYSFMMELATSIIWYVHADVPRKHISSYNSLLSDPTYHLDPLNARWIHSYHSSSSSHSAAILRCDHR